MGSVLSVCADCDEEEDSNCIPKEVMNKLWEQYRNDERIPWGFAKDCCYTRAQIMVNAIPDEYHSAINKIWAFSDRRTLIVLKKNRDIEWFYHVAPLVNICEKGKMVIDPSIFSEPVTPEEWLNSMENVVRTFNTPGRTPYYTDGDGSSKMPTLEKMEETLGLHTKRFGEESKPKGDT